MPVQVDGPPLTDPAAERLVLCGLLWEPGLNGPAVLAAGVTSDDFGVYHHGLVFARAWDLIGCGAAVGPWSVWRYLAETGELCELPDHNPARWLADLLEDDPTGAWCGWGLARVKWAARKRAVSHWAARLAEDITTGRLVPLDPWFKAVEAVAVVSP